MTDHIQRALQELTQPFHMWRRDEILRSPSPIPTLPGVYGWYFDESPHPAIDISKCVSIDGKSLLYIGIAPKAPPRQPSRASSSTLRSRLRQHFAGNAEGSTLRLTLGCLLADRLDIRLTKKPGGRSRTFGAGEKALNDWLQQHAAVATSVCEQPWLVESALITRLSLPLNMDMNQPHPFCETLKAIRATAKRAVA